MNIQSESFEKIHHDYHAALIWLHNIGVIIGSGRTNKYLEVIEYWKDAYMSASKDEGIKRFPEFVSSMYEIDSFVNIYKAFRDVPQNHLSEIIKKLQKGVNGPINSLDETQKSTTARNFLYEAIVAARVHRPNDGIEALLQTRSDTGIKLGDTKIWVECKRVISSTKIDANIKKASSQLEKLLKKQIGTRNRGIVALDVTKLLNKGDKIFVSDNDYQLKLSIDNLMDQFIQENKDIWENIYVRRSKKIIGTIISFSFMATSESRNLLVHTSEWGVNPRKGVSRQDEMTLRSLTDKLRLSR